MQANELRIGNITKQGIVIELRQNAARLRYTSDRERTSLIEYEYIEPIPLTEEWLIKFGFYKANYGWFRKTIAASKNVSEVIILHINIISKSTSLFGDEVLEAIYLKECQYVHQLQNLIFALTGSELKKV